MSTNDPVATDDSAPADDDSVQLISDGEGLAVLGSATAVELFMASSGLAPKADEMASRLTREFSLGSGALQTAAKHAENSGRWLKMTKESAAKVKAMGGLTPTKTPGIAHAMLGRPGRSKSWIQVVQTPGTALANPAALANLGGIMSQMAMQQQLDAITEYLEKIDEKLDGLIRTQTNQVLARVDAAGLAIAEAMSVREATGRVSEVAWSKVQNQSTTILETQAFALRQLSDLAAKFEGKAKVADILQVSEEVKDEITNWFSILARCSQLHEAHALLELDRVMDSSPEQLDSHRMGLQAARRDRVELFHRATQRILDQLNAAAKTANSKVLFNPSQSPAVVELRNVIVSDVRDFQDVLGIESGAEPSDARRWRQAASDQLDRARESGSHGIDTAKRVGDETRHRAASLKDRLSGEIAERRDRRSGGDKEE